MSLGLDHEPSEQELWHALDMAQAADFVKDKDLGLDEPVESFGRNFSGGQRQTFDYCACADETSTILDFGRLHFSPRLLD
mgnify:CR=1 FL=1